MAASELVKAGLKLMAAWFLAPLVVIAVLIGVAWIVVTLKERR